MHSTSDDDPRENIFREIVHEARTAEKAGDLTLAERKYQAAISFAITTYGENSKFVATAEFHLGAFYAAQEKSSSAKSCFEQVKLLLRF